MRRLKTTNAECASLVSTFSQFFVDKVNRIRDSIAVELQSTVRRLFTARPYLGPTLSSFRPVTTEEVRRLLSAMPSKSSPLDVLPCSLLKSCSDVFAPVITKLANLSMQTGKFPASYKRAQVLPLLRKLDSTVHHRGTSASTSPLTGRAIPQKLLCWRFSMESIRLPTTSRSLS